MSFLGFAWYYVVLFLCVLTVLIYVHEWGHYWVARRNNVRIEVFSIGFGPEIYGWTNAAGTRWKIGAFPLGGYVKMFGETDSPADAEGARPMTPEERAVSFSHKRVGQRALIFAAGPVANFLFAVLVFAGLAAFVGMQVPLAAVGHVMPGSAAEEAGLKPGDTVLSIDGKPVERFEELRAMVGRNPGVRIEIKVRRDGAELAIAAVPRGRREIDGSGKPVETGLLGVRPDFNQILYERQNPFMALWIGVERTVAMCATIVSFLADMFVDETAAEQLGGPLRIAQLSGDMAQGGLVNLLVFMAALSVNLGLINLFPVPMLDGGHLAFCALEVVRGRPVRPIVQEYSFRFGLVLVILLMGYATWNDLKQLRVFELIRGLIT